MKMKTIGVLGAGQLGLMIGTAANRLGLNCIFLDPAENSPASSVGPVITAPFHDEIALMALANRCDIITYEFESVPVSAVRFIETACPVLPSPIALDIAQDRVSEKQLFESLLIPTTNYYVVDKHSDIILAIESLGLPLVLKTRRFGYDGKGQIILKNIKDAKQAFESLGSCDIIAEQFVRFDREVSVIGARDVNGNIVVYSLSENKHLDGILRTSHALIDDCLCSITTEYISRLLTELNYIGVLALELFVVGDEILANEFAPRVHNSGHWTIEGSKTSQFENHVRAICGMELHDTSSIGFPVMVNIFGSMPKELSGFSDVVLHDYGKVERLGRKVGHATFVGSSEEERDAKMQQLCNEF